MVQSAPQVLLDLRVLLVPPDLLDLLDPLGQQVLLA